jgi:hypothetical protein
MHIFFITRGIKHSRDLWVDFMKTQMFHWERNPILKDEKNNFLKNPDGSYKLGNPEFTMVQGALRPIEFWEYVVPKERLPEVLAMQNLQGAFPLRPEVNNMGWVLRKLLHAKKIPQDMLNEIKDKQAYQITDKFIPMMHNVGGGGMAVYPIGIKEDNTHAYTWNEGTKDAIGYFQEGL